MSKTKNRNDRNQFSKKQRRDHYRQKANKQKTKLDHKNRFLKDSEINLLASLHSQANESNRTLIEDELRERDASYILQSSLMLTEESVDDASVLLLHEYYSREDDLIGLVSWVIEEFKIVVSMPSTVTENGVYCTFYKSRYWFYEFNASATKALLLRVSDEKKIEPKKIKYNGFKVCLHAINRLTTRYLNKYINQGYLCGVGILKWLSNLIESQINKIKYAKAEQLNINLEGMNFVLRKGAVYSMVTVF
ncbi:hypothetical protein UA32_12145 [Photobacterium angustum]|uniref:Uncharacterized protein n=1 Tax=Photobacterium angustum TaxID=661 RepID=A0ABX5GZ87_PHOAN|nr:hypothetical protein [Photobacterium angustum]KJG37706.1 hypothetical protein UA32_12145 [Photobacterium angustum]PSX03962.1 hypothetical protein C0W27_20935 [Photobacterium angustum]